MKKKLFWLLASILIIPLVAGCGSTSTTNGTLSTPRKTWVAFVSAMDAGNAQAFYALLSSSAKAGAGGSAGDASTLMSRWKSSLFAPVSFSKATIAGINENDGQATIKINDLVIHPGRHQVLVSDRPVDLTASEFRILLFMARKPGWVFTRQQIVDAAQGDDVYVNERFVTDRSVDVHIVSLRRKLGACGAYIETVRGVGYRLQDE